MERIVQPYTYHLIVWLLTLLVSVFFGFLLGVMVSERRFTIPKRNRNGVRF